MAAQFPDPLSRTWVLSPILFDTPFLPFSLTPTSFALYSTPFGLTLSPREAQNLGVKKTDVLICGEEWENFGYRKKFNWMKLDEKVFSSIVRLRAVDPI